MEDNKPKGPHFIWLIVITHLYPIKKPECVCDTELITPINYISFRTQKNPNFVATKKTHPAPLISFRKFHAERNPTGHRFLLRCDATFYMWKFIIGRILKLNAFSRLHIKKIKMKSVKAVIFSYEREMRGKRTKWPL